MGAFGTMEGVGDLFYASILKIFVLETLISTSRVILLSQFRPLYPSTHSTEVLTGLRNISNRIFSMKNENVG